MPADWLNNLRQSQLISFLRGLIPNILVNLFYHYPLSLTAVLYYRKPAKNLTVIGVTGTDGKTTTSTLIYEILKKAKFKTTLISTVSAKIGNLDLATGFHVTSPDPWQLQKLLRLIVDKGYKYLVLETTSHGLDQFRFTGISYYIGVLTNITREHLDYHQTFANYQKAKAKLFKKVKFSILNKDDPSFEKLKRLSKGKIISYGLKNADITPKNFPFKSKLPGDYNCSNCLAAISTAKVFNISDETIRKALLGFKGVKGRIEEINLGQDFKVYIDFAHTPNGLENALKTLKNMPHKRIIAVFGCAGLRDKEKRPLMGKIACRFADLIVLTAEDPRTEDVNKIIDQIASGCNKKDKIIKEPDREKAINKSILDLAKKGDIIGFFGKGHEQSLCCGKEEKPWSEHEAVISAIKRRLNK